MALFVRMAVAALLALWAGGAMACGPDSDCMIGERSYRITLPEGEGPFGAIVFMHGYKGTAAGTMANASLRALASELGVALIAAHGEDGDWQIAHYPGADFADDSRELAYFDALLADVTTRFPVDPDRILASGFSSGGMITWTLACRRGDRFAAFLAVAGTFWAPIPDSCPNPPIDLIHINGTTDTVVPIEGRPIAGSRQGDARKALAMFIEDGGYSLKAPPLDAPEGLACEGSATPGGKRIYLCLHGGGHEFRSEWAGFAYKTFVAPAP